MISKSLALQVLNAALATGGDYAEIYAEQNDSDIVMLENGKVESCGGPESFGAGIRILKGLHSVYGYTSDLRAKSLLALADKLAGAYQGERVITVASISKQRVKELNKVTTHYKDIPVAEKIAYLKEWYAITAGVDPRIVRVQNGLISNLKQIEIYAADGPEAKLFENSEERGRVVDVAIAASAEGQIETSFAGPGRFTDFNWFTHVLRL
jgi:TldD protein